MKELAQSKGEVILTGKQFKYSEEKSLPAAWCNIYLTQNGPVLNGGFRCEVAGN
jgi:hypothetical protein